MVAQQFVDTGPYPTSFRVMTVFGRPAYSLASIALNQRPGLDPNGIEPLDILIASNAGARRVEMNHAEDIVEMGVKTYNAFPSAPVHGVDVVREASTGILYVLEFNPAGFTWHLSSPYLARLRAELELDLYGQFDALNVIADVLIEKTRAEAV
jgi:hypothetical protein